MRITFCGAAETVTGSQHLVEIHGRRFLLDCGLYQGRRDEARRRNAHFHFDPRGIEAVLLSHAHIDHAGNLPTLVGGGFRGPIFCTPATADLAGSLLRDSAKIQEEDLGFLNKHRKRRGEHAVEPLYTMRDAERALRQLRTKRYGQEFTLGDGLHAMFHDAGHVLGSAIVRLEAGASRGAPPRRFVFTGDLGRWGQPILRDPEAVPKIDVLLTEATYGNRVHDEAAGLRQQLLEVVERVVARRGKLIIPAFALGRTQAIVYFLNEIFNEGRLPRVPIFVDSPLATRLTDTYRHHEECFDDETRRRLREDPDVFGFSGLTYVASPQESRALNDRPGPFVVISASGMCEAGRVLHHLRHSVEDPRNAVLIVGFQAPDTLGRRIVEKQPRLRIMDDWFELRAEVLALDGFSAHADREDFRRWFESTGGGIEHAFIVHGEGEALPAMSELLQPFVRNPVHIPKLYETADV